MRLWTRFRGIICINFTGMNSNYQLIVVGEHLVVGDLLLVSSGLERLNLNHQLPIHKDISPGPICSSVFMPP